MQHTTIPVLLLQRLTQHLVVMQCSCLKTGMLPPCCYASVHDH